MATSGGGEVGLTARLTLLAGLMWTTGLLLLVVGVGSLTLHGDTRMLVVDGLLLLAVWISALVCWLTVRRVGFRQWEVLLSALAATSVATGLTYAGVVDAGSGQAPPASVADVGLLLFYPLMLAALVVAVRRHWREQTSSVWLDSAVGSLGAAAVLAVLLSPVLDSVLKSPPSLSTAVDIAYPLLDVVLVAAVAGIFALCGLRRGDRWVLLLAGLLVIAGTDVVFSLQKTANAYEGGTLLDAGWGVGYFLIALYVNGAAGGDEAATRDARGTNGATALAVSSVAIAAGLGVLILSSRVPLSNMAVLLAAVTLLAAAARTHVAFRQLQRMADLRRQATTDHLTNLPNRRALYAQATARMTEGGHQRLALLLLDLDRFKEVNDSLGHQTGDQLLIHFGTRLGQELRVGDLLVRLGGDEFAVLLEDAGHDQAVDVAVKLGATLGEPFALQDIAVHSSVSIGIALYPDDGPDLNTLLRKADIAMYRAKASGSGHHVYRGADDADEATRLQTVQELRTALTSKQLIVHYQPKVHLGTGDVHGVEALVRWNHPTRGLLYPDAFVNLVEESGLMPTLTRVVLALALDQVAAWHEQGRTLTVAVNLSASSLVDTDLPKQVASMLTARDLAPGALQLEITEEFLMADRDRARAILLRLRTHGIQISIDDFGTGYSSLSYLRDLPVDELKLDRSFILPMVKDARAEALVASTIDLAHSLGLRMVAEGVENEITYDRLTHLGCDQAQGYFISRPVPAAELDSWLTARREVGKLIRAPLPRPPAALG